ncbi:MAG TPA: class I SAM-dependent methyltransferase [Ktedonobacteraceae bacterium]|nr:class I SAM-dependent methyltransferase [Ktedonobacteraceae bacterium]
MSNKPEIVSKFDDQSLKTCCANVYQSDWAKLLLGESFHPGGTALTEYLGATLHLGPNQRVLDVAAGQGTSAIQLAQRFGCMVLGIEYSQAAVESANLAAQKVGVSQLVTFQQGDAEQLPVETSSFDAVICECAFCTFPNKAVAAAEFARVLLPGGQVGLSDLTRRDEVPVDLQGLLAWIACIADAQPLESYVQYLSEAGLTIQLVEQHDEALSRLVKDIQAKLLGTELLVKLKKITLPGEIDFEQAKTMARAAASAIRSQQFGYAVVTASKANIFKPVT